jgi:hypothetical protein
MSTDVLTKPIKGFHVSHRAYYSHEIKTPEIMIGLYYPDGEGEAEFAVRWRDIGLANPIPRLEVYSDSWRLLFEMEELRTLSQFVSRTTTDQKFVDFLLDAGFTDLTKYEGQKPLKEFSVMLLYPPTDNEGGAETYLCGVLAPDKTEAIASARAEACTTNRWSLDRGNEFRVLLVARGHIIDLGDA